MIAVPFTEQGKGRLWLDEDIAHDYHVDEITSLTLPAPAPKASASCRVVAEL